MLTLVPEKIEEYARNHSEAQGDLLAELVEVTHCKTSLPQMLIGPLEGAFLKVLVGLVGGSRVLEIGTFTGYSALWMASALSENGVLTTLDLDPEATSIAKEFWARSPYGNQIELKLGPALDTLKTLEGPFDLVFIDADKESYAHYWEACVPMVRSGGLLVADNVLWSGRVLDPQDSSDHGIVRFNQLVVGDSRVDKVLLTVRDGMFLCRKR